MWVDSEEEKMTTNSSHLRIRELNDVHRKSMSRDVVITSGVASLSERVREKVIHTVAAFDTFTTDNDPHGEHDFGGFEVEGLKFFWKIDYFDVELEFTTPNRADESLTRRILTIMLADEY